MLYIVNRLYKPTTDIPWGHHLVHSTITGFLWISKRVQAAKGSLPQLPSGSRLIFVQAHRRRWQGLPGLSNSQVGDEKSDQKTKKRATSTRPGKLLHNYTERSTMLLMGKSTMLLLWQFSIANCWFTRG